jgi:NAD(P)-dependent dehydrogenase (short-subunit alcohol dehydrogenase family)
MKIWLPEELYFLRNGNLPQKKSTESLKGKLCVISGATSGVGLETLKRFARGEADIVVVARNKEKATKIINEVAETYNVKIDLVIGDFSNLDSVRNAAKEIVEKYEKIDVLVNSVGVYSTKRILNEDGIELVFCVNHLAVFLFTRLLLDRLKESAPSRILQVNSEGHRFGGLHVNNINFKRRFYMGMRSYGASKVAQMLTVFKMADELKGTGVTINAVHPGEVKSNIGSNNGFLYRWWSKHVTQKMLKDPKISGESIYYLAADKEMEGVSGNFYNLTILEKPAWHIFNEKKKEAIWKKSFEMSGLEIID